MRSPETIADLRINALYGRICGGRPSLVAYIHSLTVSAISARAPDRQADGKTWNCSKIPGFGLGPLSVLMGRKTPARRLIDLDHSFRSPAPKILNLSFLKKLVS